MGLGERKITATFRGGNLKGLVTRDCPHRDVLLPLMWSLVVDKLTAGLNENECYILGYADDIAILICKKFSNTFLELL
jgi:hypothetical protein